MDEWYQLPGFNQPMSSMSHLLAALVFLVLAIVLVSSAWWSRVRFLTCCLFGFAAVTLLSLSGVFHMFAKDHLPSEVMIRLDVAAIFFLIASTFTPVHATLFKGWKRWGVLLPIWTIAITGITLRTIFFDNLPHIWGTAIFLFMGWVGLYSTLIVHKRYGKTVSKPIIVGGVLYTIGAITDSAKWPTIVPMVWGSHETFHLFVIAGLSCHWYLIARIADGSIDYREPANKDLVSKQV